MSAKPPRRILVCGRGECTSRQVSRQCYDHLAELLAEYGLDDPTHPQATDCKMVSCLGVCVNGPIVMVHPEGVLYHKVNQDAMRRIVEEHLLNEKPVEDFILNRLRAKKRRRVK